MTTPRSLQHPLLVACGVAHGFGVRGAAAPAHVLRPRQVHGAVVAEPVDSERLEPAEADAVVSVRPGLSVGIVTADCVPILLSTADGGAVAAVHAGWRGLAAGVLEAGLERLRQRATPGARIVAAIGPHIGACCYEVDGVVRRPLRERYADDFDRAFVATGPDRGRLDLGRLAATVLLRLGLSPEGIGSLAASCTACDPERFHSYRRDGEHAGRLLHHVAAWPRAGTGPSSREAGS